MAQQRDQTTGNASVPNANATQERNPALAALAGLLGEWDMAVSQASFLDDPSAILEGYARAEWIADGACIMLRQGARSGPPVSTWVIGRDEGSDTYLALYYDDRGVSRIYSMSFVQGTWTVWREAAGFSQRFTATFSNDDRSIAGEWESSSDGKVWEHDFNLTYTRRRV